MSSVTTSTPRTGGPHPAHLTLARFLLLVLTRITQGLALAAWLLEGAGAVLGRVWKTLPVVVAAGVVTTLSTASCGPLDMGCKIDEWQAGWLQGLNATFGILTQSMIEGVFTSRASTINSAGWNVGLTSVNRLAAVMAIVVVGLCAIQIIMTLIAKQKTGIIRAVVGAALAWPVCALSVIVAIQLVRWADQLSESIIANSDAIATLSTLVDMAWVASMATGNAVAIAMASLFFLFVIFIPTVLLTIVMAFRNYALVVAIAVAPVSLMTWGLKSLQGMVRGWGKITAALVLTKPVMALSIMIAGEMVGAGLTGGGIGPFMTGVVGLFTAAAAPATSMAMVTGAMAIADGGISRGMEQKGVQSAHQAGSGAKNLGRRGFKAFGGGDKVKAYEEQGVGKVKSGFGSFFNRGQGNDGGKGGENSSSTPAPNVAPIIAPGLPSPAATPGTAAPAGGGSKSGPSKPGGKGGAGEAPQGTGAGRKTGEEVGGAGGHLAGSTAGGAMGGAVGSVVPVVGTVIGEQVGSQLGGETGHLIGQQFGGAVGGAVDTVANRTDPAGSEGPGASPIFANEPAAVSGGSPPSPPNSSGGGSGGSTTSDGGSTRGGADLSGGLK